MDMERDITPVGGARLYTIYPSRANYFSFALDKYLLNMLRKSGNVAQITEYTFKIDPQVFDFYLFYF